MWEFCRDCSHRCHCCSSSINYSVRCSGCECHYDEFRPIPWMGFCPLYGTSINELKENKISS